MYDFKFLTVLFGLILLMIANPVVLAKPVANAQIYPYPNNGEGLVPLQMTLDASESEGDIEEYDWTVKEAGDKEDIKLSGKKATLTLDQPGTYTITLTVTDKDGVSDTLENAATVKANKDPNACFNATPLSGNASENQPLKVKLDASCSKENIVDYKWEVNGRSAKEKGQQVTLFFEEPGDYLIALLVSNNKGQSDVTKEIKVGQLIAKATFVRKDTIELDATASEAGVYQLSDLTYHWEAELFGESSLECEEMTPIFTAQTAQTTKMSFFGTTTASCRYRVTLEITDPDGMTSEDSIIVDQEPQTTPPNAKITAVSPVKGFAPLTLNLDGSDSFDEDGTITEYTWLATHDEEGFGFEKTTSSPKTTITLEQSGVYTISLFVTDNHNENSEQVVFKKTVEDKVDIVKIEIVNERPIAKAKILPSLDDKGQKIPLEMILDGSESRDKDGKLEKYTWTITNDSGYEKILESEEPTIPHQFDQVGRYHFSLIVTDNEEVDSEATVISYKRIEGSLSIEPQYHRFSLPEGFVYKEPSKPIPSESQPVPETRRIQKRAREYWPGRVIVKFREGTSTEIRTRLREFYQAQFLNALSSINAEVWQVEDVEAAIATQSHRAFSEIVSIRPDYVIRAQDIRAMNNNLWRKSRDKKDETLSIETKESVLCAVLDSGVDYTHQDLVPYIWTNPGETPNNGIDDDDNGYVDDVHGYNFVNNDGDPMDDCGHGTHVAGIIAGLANQNENAGITATEHQWPAKILALKILKAEKNSQGMTECIGAESTALLALKYVQENADKMGIKCTNNSWGGETDPNTDLESAIKTEANQGRLFIVSSGNNFPPQDNDKIFSYPANYESENVISVCSVGPTGNLSLFSHFGKQSVDLCALGEEITSTYSNPKNGYHKDQGTSMAAAYVTGAVTVLWSAFPDLSPFELKTHLLASVKRIKAKDKNATNGRLNLRGAIDYMNSRQKTFTVTNTGDMAMQIEQIMLVEKDGDQLGTEDFQIHENDNENACSNNKQLAPKEVCTVEVFFAPSFTDKKEVLLKVTSNVPVSQEETATISGKITNNKIAASSWNSVSCNSVTYEGEMPTELAEASVYNLKTGELEIPSVVLPTETGINRFEVKLCPIGEQPMSYSLCYDDDLNPYLKSLESKPKLGDTTLCIDEKTKQVIVNMPIVRTEPNTNLLYEVYMNMLTNSDGGVEFEIDLLNGVIPIH
ncbi:MAG: S8 family serine peptidase [Candidatus Parabeggiatoa sp.]|nr:S8 family serine peptidase [Candidatus Parabeggiatoa sp.]